MATALIAFANYSVLGKQKKLTIQDLYTLANALIDPNNSRLETRRAIWYIHVQLQRL